MSRVTNLLAELSGEARPPKTITQTVRIPQLSYHKLRALAPLFGRSFGNIASRLLAAAIDDAIDALPNDERLNWGGESGRKLTAREYVLEIAQNSWIEATTTERDQSLTLHGLPTPAGKPGLRRDANGVELILAPDGRGDAGRLGEGED
jgi:hypothetical protein